MINESDYEPFDDETVDLANEREELLSLLDDSMGVIKCEASLAKAADRAQKLLDRVSLYPRSYEALRLKNDTQAALIAIRAAMERKSSIGSHYRDDGAEETEKYRIEIKKNGEGLDIHRTPV